METTENDKIIVLTSYATLMEANLAKTKLDAYGVPCFLTDENFIGVYPLYNNVFPGVRLHIFEKDTAKANEILGESVEIIQDKPEPLCPRCDSANIIFNDANKAWFSQLFVEIFVAPFFHPAQAAKCRNCGHEWDYKSVS